MGANFDCDTEQTKELDVPLSERGSTVLMCDDCSAAFIAGFEMRFVYCCAAPLRIIHFLFFIFSLYE